MNVDTIIGQLEDALVKALPPKTEGPVRAILDAYVDLAKCKVRISELVYDAEKQGMSPQAVPGWTAAEDAMKQAVAIAKQEWELQAKQVLIEIGPELAVKVLGQVATYMVMRG